MESSRSVNWAHPMNNSTHLPPKSPHGAYSMFSSSGANLFENYIPLHPHPHPYRRSPSAGCVGQQWLSDRLGSSDVVLKRCSHRRSSSDSVALVDNSHHYMNYLENVTEEDELFTEPPLPAAHNRPAYHRRGVSADHGSGDQSLQYKLPATHRPSYPEKRGDHNINRPDREHSFPRQQPRHETVAGAYSNRVAGPFAKSAGPLQEDSSRKAKKHVTLATTLNSRSDSAVVTAAPRGRSIPSCIPNITSTTPTFENRSTASESNSHSDDSGNDDVRARRYERFRSDSEARSEEGGDGTAHDGCTSSDQVDPKKAKRILANRQSAQRSRVRKLQYISELEMNVNLLETEVASLSPKVGFYDHERALLSAENALLKQKLAALIQTQLLKEAYNKTLTMEVQRLHRDMCTQHKQPPLHYAQQQQQQQQLQPMQQHIQQPIDLQLLQFSKLELGPPIPKPNNPRSAGGSLGGRPSLYPTTKVISPTRSLNSNNTHNSSNNNCNRPSIPQRVPPSCMAPGGKGFGAGAGVTMMGGAGTSFMVHNS